MGTRKRADEKLVEMAGSRRKYRAMGSRLAAKGSSPPLGAGRGPVNEGRGSYPWCCCGLGLEEVCGGQPSQPCQACLCPLWCTSVPRRKHDCPSLFPSHLLLLFLLLLPAPRIWPVRVEGRCGAVSWGACPNIFWGKRLLSHELPSLSPEDKPSICLGSHFPIPILLCMLPRRLHIYCPRD